MVKVGTRQVVYRPPPAADIPVLVGELVAWWNDQCGPHPVIAAGIGEFQLAHIQPFAGGNGLHGAPALEARTGPCGI